MTVPGNMGLMEVYGRNSDFTYYKSLICLKYTGKILGLLGQSFSSYKHCKGVTTMDSVNN